MRIIPPIEITDTNFVSSNVPENDYPVYDNTATYSQGDKVILTTGYHSIYECVIAEGETVTGVHPENDETDPPSWLRIDSTNRWRAFDGQLGNPTKYKSTITWNGVSRDGILIEVKPSKVVNSVALFGVDGINIYIEVVDDVEGLVHQESISLNDNSAVSNWYEYFYADIIRRTEAVSFDLPQYLNATVRIFIEAAEVSDAEVKEVVFGKQVRIGCALYGIDFSIENYSRKERDSFGNPVIVERDFAKLLTFDLKIRTNEVDFVNKTLQSYRAKPVVYSVIDKYDSSIIYGFYRDFSTVIPSYNVSRCQLELIGLNETL